MRLLLECFLILIIASMAAHILLVEDSRDEYKFFWHQCLEGLEEIESSCSS